MFDYVYLCVKTELDFFVAFILNIKALVCLSIAVLYSLGLVGLIFLHEEVSACFIFVLADLFVLYIII